MEQPTQMSSKEQLKFVVVGSVDHGKSTLIGRFLYDTGSLPKTQLDAFRAMSEDTDEKVEFAFVLDHLAEERARHITIDTAQTFFSSESRDYVIIDAPGHKEFMKNMITGASQASAAMLLLDVDEGLMEQTHRHAYMLSALGVKQLIVVLNKMDLVDYSQEVFTKRSDEMLALLAKVALEKLAVIPAAALDGENIVNRSEKMPWYDGPTIIESLDLLKCDPSGESLPLRLPVQDVYDLEGRDVAVGRIASGMLSTGQQVVIFPENKLAEVATVEKMEGQIDSAASGESIGFTLTNGDVMARGKTLCAPDAPPKQDSTITASIFWMSPAPLKKGDQIILRLATQEAVCTVDKIANRMDSGSLEVIDADAGELANTEVAEVTFSADKPLHYDSFVEMPEMGRLVLMRGLDIVAGGIMP